MKTALITGCSSGFGLETAKYFLDRDWNVIATMRTPREDLLPCSDRLRVLALDVADPESIRSAVEAAGPIDVLVNNAGIGLMGIFEGTSIERTREVFETNTFGTLMMTQEVLPQFRQRKSGVIVNVSSGIVVADALAADPGERFDVVLANHQPALRQEKQHHDHRRRGPGDDREGRDRARRLLGHHVEQAAPLRAAQGQPGHFLAQGRCPGRQRQPATTRRDRPGDRGRPRSGAGAVPADRWRSGADVAQPARV